MLWHGFPHPASKVHGTQRFEWASKVDWDGYIEDGGLTELHLIISGLRNLDLETYLRAHPEDLETTDGWGWCPLWCASMFGELADIPTLLKYGAILDKNTFNFTSFFSNFGTKAFDFMDEHLSPGALKCLFREGCARDWFRELHTGQLDIDEILAVDKLCLEHGFPIDNVADEEEETLLMSMLRRPYTGLRLRVKQLLDHGLDLELTDIYGKTALHHCIEAFRYDDIHTETFNVLVENGARLDYRTRDGTTILHALILEVVHVEPIEIIFRSDIGGLLLEAKDSNGYTAFDLLIIRARLLRLDSGDCSVSLQANHTIDDILEFEVDNVVAVLGDRMLRAEKPDMERKFLAAFEALLHKVQEVQGIPPEEQYPSVESVLDQEDMDAEASRLEGLPGSWPE